MTLERNQRALATIGLAMLISCSQGGEAGLVTAAGSTGNTGAAAIAGGSSALGGATGVLSSVAGGSSGSTSSVVSDVHAHVTAVLVQGAEGSYVFSVSVESSDVDCSQYADWWEVLDQNGSLLYRRILNHCHTDENGTSDPNAPGNTFTRSSDPDTIALRASQVAIVRAHMNTAGYRGTAMRGTPADGFAAASDIGPGFAAGVEREDPQPAGCLF